MALKLSQQEEQAVKEFLNVVNQNGSSSATRNEAVKFMMARKFDKERALNLYHSHEIVRKREGLAHFDPNTYPLKNELESAKFTILSSRDYSGAAIALFTAVRHDPLACDHKITLQAVVYQLDVALEQFETQRNGLVFIYNMAGSKYSNFDYELGQKILSLLKGAYPARLKKVLIVAPPLWFKAPFKFLQLFVREKLRDRVYMVNLEQLTQHLTPPILPQELGGTLEVNHLMWLRYCLKKRNASLKSISNEKAWPEDNREKEVEVIKEPAFIEAFQSQPEENQEKDNDIILARAGLPFDNDLGVSLEDFIEQLKFKKRSGLYKEYAEIKQKAPEGTFENSRLRLNQHKNRYGDVLSLDGTRVKLTADAANSFSDYINANYVDGYKQKRAFISTQGPLPQTYQDFWQMVWENSVKIVVMCTKTMERSRPKCGQYWPLQVGQTLVCGAFHLSNSAVNSQEEYIITQLVLTHLQTNISRKIIHTQFISWPDYGVPNSAISMLEFREAILSIQESQQQQQSPTPPIVVHCSAGIGRTGTYITLDITIKRLEEKGLIDIKGTVEAIRSQRAYSIQMPDQYVFCHLALIEYAYNKKLLTNINLDGFFDN